MGAMMKQFIKPKKIIIFSAIFLAAFYVRTTLINSSSMDDMPKLTPIIRPLPTWQKAKSPLGETPRYTHTKDSFNDSEAPPNLNISSSPDVKQSEDAVRIAPSNVAKLNLEFLEELEKTKEKSGKILTGLFHTKMDIKQEENKVVASISLNNTSQEDLELSFDMSREFEFIVTNRKGDEVYCNFNNNQTYLPAISHHRLKKGEKLSFQYTWNRSGNDGNIIAKGVYTISIKMLPTIEGRSNFSQEDLTAVRSIEIN
jgi:hypothetical protein